MFIQDTVIEHPKYGKIFKCDIEWFEKYVKDEDITFDPTDNSLNKLHTNFYPEQIAGDINNSNIFLLNMNPSFDPSNQITLLQYQPEILDNINNKFDSEYPFYCLNPKYDTSDGNKWWLGGNHFGSWLNRYSRKELAHSFCCLELLPYHCKNLPSSINNNITKCPSASRILEYVNTKILDLVSKDQATLILLRCAKVWGVEQSDNIFFTTNYRKAYFGDKLYSTKQPERNIKFINNIHNRIYK